MTTDLITGDDGLARPAWASTDPLLREYYDTEWGMPVRDEHGLFERLSLEAFQSGLAWITILRKREAFRAAFAGFSIEAVAQFGDEDVARLMADAFGHRFVAISAVLGGVKDVREAVDIARAERDATGRGTIVFVDEVQRALGPMPL